MSEFDDWSTLYYSRNPFLALIKNEEEKKMSDAKMILDVKVDGLEVTVTLIKFDLPAKIEYILYSFDDYRALIIASAEVEENFMLNRVNPVDQDIWEAFSTGGSDSHNIELVVGVDYSETFLSEDYVADYLNNLKQFCRDINGESSKF